MFNLFISTRTYHTKGAKSKKWHACEREGTGPIIPYRAALARDTCDNRRVILADDLTPAHRYVAGLDSLCRRDHGDRADGCRRPDCCKGAVAAY